MDNSFSKILQKCGEPEDREGLHCNNTMQELLAFYAKFQGIPLTDAVQDWGDWMKSRTSSDNVNLLWYCRFWVVYSCFSLHNDDLIWIQAKALKL